MERLDTEEIQGPLIGSHSGVPANSRDSSKVMPALRRPGTQALEEKSEQICDVPVCMNDQACSINHTIIGPTAYDIWDAHLQHVYNFKTLPRLSCLSGCNHEKHTPRLLQITEVFSASCRLWNLLSRKRPPDAMLSSSTRLRPCMGQLRPVRMATCPSPA